eukprot:6299380-Amphidinium_carterae.1
MHPLNPPSRGMTSPISASSWMLYHPQSEFARIGKHPFAQIDRCQIDRHPHRALRLKPKKPPWQP